MSYSSDCFLSDILDHYKIDIPLVFFRVIFSLLQPVVYVIIFFILFIFITLTKIAKLKFRAIYTTLIYLFLFLQPGLMQQIIELVSCKIIGSYSFMKAYGEMFCYTPIHNHYIIFLVLPSIMLLMFIFPGILFIALYKNRFKLTNVDTLMKYGFLY